jgi:hypothetical protein
MEDSGSLICSTLPVGSFNADGPSPTFSLANQKGGSYKSKTIAAKIILLK